MKRVDVIKIAYFPPSKGYAVILKEWGGDRQLPIIVGSTEAQAIALALENIEMPRPLTHDLLVNILDNVDAEVTKISISELRSGTFYANIEIRIENKVIESEFSPIHHGKPVRKATSVEEKISGMKKALNQAIELENYEIAALLRDKLNQVQEERKS
jgi:bifunctional DNase/RNase